MAVKIPEKERREEIKPRRGLRVNYLIIFLSGLLILIGAVLVFLLVVKNVYGNYDLSEILPTKANLKKLAYEEKAAVLYSKYTENRFEEGNTWVQDNVSTWETYLNIINMPFEIISDQDIEKGKHQDYKILILPGAQSISDKQIVEIKKYLDNGGSVFATAGTASYSNEGKWRGWEFFTEVYGMKFTREIKPEEKFKIHTLRGNLPITAEIPTGYTLKIATWDRPIYAEILEPRVEQVSFWYDYRREKGLVREEIKKSAGISYGSYGKGRFVWYGFQLNSVIGKQDDYIFFEKLFRNSINWLTYNPTSFVKDWPAPYEAAAILVVQVDDNPQNINNILPAVNKYNFRAAYFVDPYEVSKYTNIVKRFSQVGDIGVLTDIGYLESAIDTVNKLYDKNVQLEVVAFAKDTVLKLINSPVKGIMPYYGFYDENTLQAMSKLGIDYLITDSLTDRSVPKLEIRSDKPLLVITKTARDDFEVIHKYGLTDQEFQIYTYEEDIDRLLFEGGLYVLKLRPEYQLQPQYSKVVDDLVKYMRDKKMWLTSVPELMNWWQRKGGIEVRYLTRSKRRISVDISNPKDTKMVDFVVQVNLNKKVKNIQISSDIINTKIPDYQFDSSTNTLYLFIDKLDPGETRNYLVDFENVNT